MSVGRKLKKWRWVAYLGDGIDQYECLACKDTWEGRGNRFSFCGFCGIRWEGELVWNTQEREERDLRMITPERPPEGAWHIQSRVLWNLQDGKGWQVMSHEASEGWSDHGASIDSRRTSAVKIHGLVKDMREQSTSDASTRVEWRAILRPRGAA